MQRLLRFPPTSLQRRGQTQSNTRGAVSFDLSEIQRDEKSDTGTRNTQSTLRSSTATNGNLQRSNGVTIEGAKLTNSTTKTWNTEDILEDGRHRNGNAKPKADSPLTARSEPISATSNGISVRPRSLSFNNAVSFPVRESDYVDGKIIVDGVEMTTQITTDQILSPDDPRITAGFAEISVVRNDPVGMAPNRLTFFQNRPPEVSADPSASRPKFERMHSGRIPVDTDLPTDDETDLTLRRKAPYQLRDMFMTLWSIVSYIWDYITDWIVAAAFFRDKDYWWFGWTVTFIVLPHLVMSLFSLAWYIQDHRHGLREAITWKQWIVRLVILFLQLAPVLRYVDSLRFGYRFRRSSHDTRHDLYESLCFENADAAMLRLFEAFMEAAPQLVLQIYILAVKQQAEEHLNFVQVMQIVSIFASWFSLATAMAAFHRAQRFSQQPKKGMSIAGTVMQFLWHLFVFASRVIAIALFCAVYTYWGPVFCGIHIICMIVWVFWMDTDFCPNRALEALYNVAVGCLYLFAFLNVKDAPTRWKYVFIIRCTLWKMLF